MRNRPINVHMAHMPGPCALAQTPDGNHVFTSGVDSTLRVHDTRPTSSSGTGDNNTVWWKADDPKEPEMTDPCSSDAHDKPVTCLAVASSGLTLASGCEDGSVRLFNVSTAGTAGTPKVDLLQACGRFAGAVRCVSFSGSGSFMAAAGEEPGLVKVIMTAQPANVNVMRAGEASEAHDAIIAVAFDRAGDLVATVGERGTAAIWDVEQSALIAVIDLNNRRATSVAWAPDGSALVFGTDKGAILVSRGRWFVDFQLEDVTDGDDDDDDDLFASTTASASKKCVAAVTWSPNARYVATATGDCAVSLWDVYNRKVLGVWKAENDIQHVAWHRKANAVVVIDTMGHWGIVPDVVPPHLPSPLTEAPKIDLPSAPNMGQKKSKKKKSNTDNGDDDDDGAAVKRSKRAKEKRQKDKERKQKAKERRDKKKNADAADAEIVDDEAEDANSEDPDNNDQQMENGFSLSDVDADDEDDAMADSQSLGSDDESSDDEEVPGELAGLENGGVHLPELKKKRHGRSGGASGGSYAASSYGAAVVSTTYEPLMPSSTPKLDNANSSKKARILVWNLVGAVLSSDEHTHDVVDVEFADANKRTVGIKDHYGYSCGCLSETGVFLASAKTKEHSAVVTFRPFASWAANADWTQFMPADEDVAVIALGERFAAVATMPHNVVRVFSLSGIQTATYGVQGAVVSACAMGDNLAVVYQTPGVSGLSVEIVEMSAVGEVEKILYDGRLHVSGQAMAKHAQRQQSATTGNGNHGGLEWIGFTSDTNEFVAYDAAGWAWLLSDMRKSKRWVPIVQNAASLAECDWFWAAAVTTDKFIGAACLSNERFPPAKPRPGLRSLVTSAPVIDRVSKNGKPTVSERLARTRLRLQRLVAERAAIEEMCDGDEDDDEELEAADDAVAKIELEADKCVLALMEDACRKEQNMRALDLSTRLNCKISFKYAIELAKHFKRTALASRVEHVAAQKIQVIDEDMRAKQQRVARNGGESGGGVNSVEMMHQHHNQPQSTHLGTSPVSMQHHNGGVGLHVGGTPNTPRKFGGVGATSAMHPALLSDDEDEGTAVAASEEKDEYPGGSQNSASGKGKSLRRDLSAALNDTEEKAKASPNKKEVSRVMDVTDDEDEGDVGRRTVTTTAEKSSNKGKKRRGGQSTAEAKRAKVEPKTEAVLPEPVNPKFKSFKNRFAKK